MVHYAAVSMESTSIR